MTEEELDDHDPLLCINEFPTCCGVELIFEFEGNTDSTAKDLEYFSKSVIGLQLIAINAEQRKKYHRTILDAGFSIVRRTYNPNSGNYITLYCRDLGMKIARKRKNKVVPNFRGRS